MLVLGIAVAAIASFIVSALLYSAPPIASLISRTSTPRPGVPMPVQLLSVVLRGVIAAGLLAVLLLATDWHGAGAGATLGAITAVLPVTILSGAVVHENVPIPTALVHMSDWVLKLVVSGLIVGSFS